MPSLTCFQTALVGSKAAKLEFVHSQECDECIKSLTGPDDKSRPLSLLALAAREPEAAAKLRGNIDIEVLEPLLSHYRTHTLRLVASLGLRPSSKVVEEITRVLSLETPLVDDITAAQFSSQIIEDNGITIQVPLDLKAPHLFLAAQIAAADESTVDSTALWTCVRSHHKNLRLSAARKLVKTRNRDLLPFLVEYIPDPEACDIAAKAIASSEIGARQLAQHANFKSLLSTPESVNSHILNLCAAAAQTDDLRLALMEQGAIKAILRSRDPPALHLLLTLTRSVRCLRSGAATKEIGELLIECLQSDDDARRASAMAVACNLVLDTSPISDMILDSALECAFKGVDSTNRELQRNSIWFLKNAAFTKCTPGFKATLMTGLGVAKLLDLCDCGDEESEDAVLGFLRNYLAYNPEGVDLWLSLCPVDLWSLVERKLRHRYSVVNALYILVHIAASTQAHQNAILERPALLRKIAVVLDDAQDEEVIIAGIWFLTNLYQKGSSPAQANLGLFKSALEKSKHYHVTIRSKAEKLIQLAGS